MGVLQVRMAVGKPNGPMEQVTATIDPEANYSMLPASLLSHLGVEVWEHNRWFIINDAEVRHDFGVAHITIDERELPCAVIFGPEGAARPRRHRLADLRHHSGPHGHTARAAVATRLADPATETD